VTTPTEQRIRQSSDKAPLRRARLLAVIAKMQRNLGRAPDDPRAPRWRERLVELEGRLAAVRQHGLDRPSDLPVGVLVGTPTMGGG